MTSAATSHKYEEGDTVRDMAGDTWLIIGPYGELRKFGPVEKPPYLLYRAMGPMNYKKRFLETITECNIKEKINEQKEKNN